MGERTTWRDYKAQRLADPLIRAVVERRQRATALCAQIRAARTATGLSQLDLARRVGTAQPSIAHTESDGTMPRVLTLDRLSRALGVDLIIEL